MHYLFLYLQRWCRVDSPKQLRRDLEHGKIEGFPGTMLLHGKPTFATLEGFYQVVFEQAERFESG
jgi:hypothetical protein